MIGEYLIVAGKEEGFEYKDGYIERVSEDAYEATVEGLKEKGFITIIVTRIVDRIDSH